MFAIIIPVIDTLI